ncbi:MAG: DMT family transporter [Chloroflexota bacterium]
MSQTHFAYLNLATAMTLVGSSVVVGKIVVTDFPIFMALTIRFAIALPPLLVFTYRHHTIEVPSRRLLMQMFLQALTGVFLFNILLLAGLKLTTAAQSGLLGSTTPALIAVFGWLLLHEHVRTYEWIGIALTVAGVLVVNGIDVSTDDMRSLNSATVIGNLLVLGAFTCEALFTVFRKTSSEIPPLMGATWVTSFGLLLCLPIGLFQLVQFDLSTININHVLVLLYYGLFVSALAYVLWFRGLEHASTSAAGILSSMLPISAVILSALILSEPITHKHLMGLVLVLSAIGLMSLAPQLTDENIVTGD